jgi:membrane protein implicated in regulation of membrane protease activity
MDLQIPFWFYWLIGAVVLVLLELLISGFVLLCFGFASFITAIVCLLGAVIELQILSFIIFTVLAFVTIRPFFLRHMKPKEGLVETNVYALIGTEAKVTEDIDPESNTGRVKIRGEEWSALSKDGKKISSGSLVKVLQVSGNKVIVQPLKQGD